MRFSGDTQFTGAGFNDIISSIRIYKATTGSALNDVLTGSASNDLLSGLNGNDQLFGNAGNDKLLGGAAHLHLFMKSLMNRYPGHLAFGRLLIILSSQEQLPDIPCCITAAL